MQISTIQNLSPPKIYNTAASVVVNNSNLMLKMAISQYLLYTLSLSQSAQK